jgi:N utilization substance protein B
MQALCQWEVQRDESDEALCDFLHTFAEAPGPVSYALNLVRGYLAGRDAIDGRITAAADRWEFARIAAVERNVMRVAVAELLGGDVPPRVAISEAIDIGREYGGAESPGFINGVLDSVLQSLADRPKAEEP